MKTCNNLQQSTVTIFEFESFWILPSKRLSVPQTETTFMVNVSFPHRTDKRPAHFKGQRWGIQQGCTGSVVFASGRGRRKNFGGHGWAGAKFSGRGGARVKLRAFSGWGGAGQSWKFSGPGQSGQLSFPGAGAGRGGAGRGVHPRYLVNNCQDTFPQADLLLGVPAANPGWFRCGSNSALNKVIQAEQRSI